MRRELTPNTSLEVSYVGSAIVHVGIRDSNLNQLSASQLALGSALLQQVPNPFDGVVPRSSSIGDPTIPLAQLLKPYPEYTTVSMSRNDVGTTAYRAVEARIERRMAGGLSYQVSHTRSKLVDDASSVFDASVLTGPVANYPVADSFNRALERDDSTGDIPNALVGSVVWAVTQATNVNAFAGFGVQRPTLVGDPELPASQRTPEHWFDTAAFQTAPVFTIGTNSCSDRRPSGRSRAPATRASCRSPRS